MDSDENEAPQPRKRLSLQKEDSGQSVFLLVAEEVTLSDKCVPKNTAVSTKLAVSNFESWHEERNEQFNHEPNRQVPDGLLLGSSDSTALCKWLSLYVGEARKQDGSPFLHKSLYLLLTGIFPHMRSNNLTCRNFLDSNQLEFASLHNAMDNVFRKLCTEGRSTEAFSKEEIDWLWVSGALSISTPKGLLQALFFPKWSKFLL